MIIENWKKFISESGYNDPMNPRDPLYRYMHATGEPMNKLDSPDDLEKKYTQSKPSHQEEGRKIAASELNILIARLKDGGYTDATDPLYDAIDKLTQSLDVSPNKSNS